MSLPARPLPVLLPDPTFSTTTREVLTDGRPRVACTARFGVTLERCRGDADAGLALARAVVEWVAAARDGLAAQLRLRALGEGLVVELLFDVTRPTREEAARRAEVRAQELAQLLESGAAGRFVPRAEPPVPEERPGRAVVRVARPGGPGLPLAAAALDDGALGRLVPLLLGCGATVTVSCRRAAGSRVLDALARRTSAALARARGRAEGLVFDGDRARIRHYPEDLVDDLDAARTHARDAAWLDRLAQLAVEVQVAVVSWPTRGRAEPIAPLLQQVHHALVPSLDLEWVELGGTSAATVLAGPGPALDLPLPRHAEDDVVLAPAPDRAIAERWLPASVASRLFRLPAPGPDGLPGLPVDPLPARPVPQLLAGVAGDAPRLGLAVSPRRDAEARLADADLARHLYVSGKTGVGKSTVLRTLLVDLARAGQGVGLVDPHGDLADELVAAIDRPVVVFDPAQPGCLGLDPVGHDGTPEGIERAVEDLTSILFRLFPGEMMGPMFDRHARALLLPLLVARRGLSDVTRLANDEAFRRTVLARLDRTDPLHEEVRVFWTEEYAGWGAQMKGEMATYTVSKFDTLLKSSSLRRVCDPGRPQLDVAAILDQGGVLVARLPEARLGPVSAWFLGMILIARLQAAVFARRPSNRRPFTLAIDEFQKFVGGAGFGYVENERTLAPLLSESRKFGLRLVLAHQYAAQLDERTRDAVFGNVGSIACFRAGARDAELLARELGGGVTPEELRGLPLYHAAARLLVAGEPTPVFTLRTIR